MGKRFQIDVSVEILDIIHIDLKKCIIFSKGKHPSDHKSNKLNMGLSSHL